MRTHSLPRRTREGQAKADYFPKLSLTGSAGRQVKELHAIILGLSNVFSIGPSISLPIFTGGKTRSNVAVQIARLKQAEATCRSTVLRTLDETDNALVSFDGERQREQRLGIACSRFRDFSG